MDGLCIARPTSSPDEFALIDRTTPTLRFIWNTGNLVLGLMPKQLIFVTLVVVFTASCSQDFLWQGGPGSELHAYRASFTASAGRELVAQVPRAQLLRDLKSAQILWLGDHHRHSRLHALQMELLQQLQQQGRAMCLGLEAIGVQDQPLVDDFLAGEINMRALREQMRSRWSGSWLDDHALDPWFFRSLLMFARQHQLPVFALEPTPRLPLAARDPYIAETVRDACDLRPDRLTVIVIGQTHLKGDGDVVARTGRDSLIIGGAPTDRLRQSPRQPAPRGTLWRADSDVFWFTEMFAN